MVNKTFLKPTYLHTYGTVVTVVTKKNHQKSFVHQKNCHNYKSFTKKTFFHKRKTLKKCFSTWKLFSPKNFFTKTLFHQETFFTKKINWRNSNCDKTQKVKIGTTQKLKWRHKSKLKLWKKSNNDKTQTQVVTKLKNFNCDKT